MARMEPRPRRGNSGRLAALLVVPAAVLVTGALLGLRLHFQPPTVPRYVVDSVGEAPVEPVDLPRGVGRTFVMGLRPQGAVYGAVGARGFLLRDGKVSPWEAPFLVARDGSMRIEGAVDTLFAGIAPGEWEVAVAVGRPETLPRDARDVLHARDPEAATNAAQAAWHLVTERIRLRN